MALAVTAASCGGQAHYRPPAGDAGPERDASAEAGPAPDAGADASADAGPPPDAGCRDDMDGDGVVSRSCGGNDCNDADPTIRPRADDPGEWVFERADELGWAVAPAIAVAADGVPHVLFEDRAAHAVVHTLRTEPRQWTRDVVEAGGRAPAAVFGADGHLHAVLVGAGSDPAPLRAGVFAADSWELETAVPAVAGHETLRPALAAGAGDLLVVAFADADGTIVRLAVHADGGWTTEDVAPDGGPAEPTDGPVSLALGEASTPWLAWQSGDAIRVGWRVDDSWSVESIPLAGPGAAPAIALAPDGSPVVSTFDVGARAEAVARRALDGTWTVEIVDDRHGAGEVSAIAVDDAGAVNLLYFAPDRLDARWATDAYGGWLRLTIDRSAEAALAITLGADGAIHMAYGTSDSDLHWARHVGGDGIDQDCDGIPDDG